MGSMGQAEGRREAGHGASRGVSGLRGLFCAHLTQLVPAHPVYRWCLLKWDLPRIPHGGHAVVVMG